MRGAAMIPDPVAAESKSKEIVANKLAGSGAASIVGAELTNPTGDPDFNAVSASDNLIDHTGVAASLTFSFDVSDIELIYGGNVGDIIIQVLDANSVVLDSFGQESTNNGEPAGPPLAEKAFGLVVV